MPTSALEALAKMKCSAPAPCNGVRISQDVAGGKPFIEGITSIKVIAETLSKLQTLL